MLDTIKILRPNIKSILAQKEFLPFGVEGERDVRYFT